MKLLLSGYEGSKRILGASSYLASKYLADRFDLYYLNYGQYDGSLFKGTYVSLAERQVRPENWSADIARYLETLTDTWVIFSLDDFLLSAPCDVDAYESLRVKLTALTTRAGLAWEQDQPVSDYESMGCGMIRYKQHAEYSSSTQYSIWNRVRLIDLLHETTTPWDFEIKGTDVLNRSAAEVLGVQTSIMSYPMSSALSKRWEPKVKVIGNPKADVDELIVEALLSADELLR